jgi:hypothetical protein
LQKSRRAVKKPPNHSVLRGVDRSIAVAPLMSCLDD